MSDHWLVVGLGNPESEYGGTRHNVGADVVRALAARHHVELRRNKKIACEEATTSVAGQRLTLVLPTSYMNLSGGPVQQATRWHSVPPANVVLVHDELDLDLGQLRVKRGGSSSHNGVKDVVRALGTPEVLRVRFGVGRPPGRMAGRDFVLRRFSEREREEVDVAVQEAADAVESLVAEGLEPTQNRFHARRREPS